MLFNSLEFLAFLVVVYGLYRVLSFRWQNALLLVASYVFYGWWDWSFLFLMILSTTIDFWSGLVLERGRLVRSQVVLPASFVIAAVVLLVGLDFSELLHWLGGAGNAGRIVPPRLAYVAVAVPLAAAALAIGYLVLTRQPEELRRRACVALSVIVQLVVLATFKYFNFFIDSLVEALHAAGVQVAARHFDIVLPVGISFYTFQSMSYAIDIYRKEIRATDHFFDFALFVAFFPQLVAGPIERARHLLPQMTQARTMTFEATTRGLFLIVFGLFKKIAIADGLAGTVDQAFATADASWGTIVAGTIAFSIQIYCDFSGYSDIARGVAKLFGVDLMLNFNQPYFSRSPREFWHRWHISLSTWLSDYLYKSLGGSRGSLLFTCRNLMITMALGGLWHGAAWNYVLWGLYHGLILSIHRVMLGRFGPASDGPVAALAKIFGFGLITLYGWLLFRAHSLDQVVAFTRTLATFDGGLAVSAAKPAFSAALGVVFLTGWEMAQYRAGGSARFYQRLPSSLAGLLIAVMIFLTLMGLSNEPAQFIYFQF